MCFVGDMSLLPSPGKNMWNTFIGTEKKNKTIYWSGYVIENAISFLFLKEKIWGKVKTVAL